MAKLKIKTKKELKQRNAQTYTQTTKAALAVQRWYRGYVARKEVNRIRNATIQLQAGARGMLARKQQRYENAQAAKIQCLYRGHRARRAVNEKVRAPPCHNPAAEGRGSGPRRVLSLVRCADPRPDHEPRGDHGPGAAASDDPSAAVAQDAGLRREAAGGVARLLRAAALPRGV